MTQRLQLFKSLVSHFFVLLMIGAFVPCKYDYMPFNGIRQETILPKVQRLILDILYIV
nr:MAG TPA: hypothetical protein [Caudoviricetes sp.]